jgi:hypothetical protein
MLRRDFLLKPLPALGLLAAIEVAFIAWDRLVGFPGYGFYLGTSLVLGFMLSFVVLRPMGNNLLAAGIAAGGRFQPGDFRASWSVLPVRIETVLRGVYLHGMATGLLIWGFAVGINLLDTWLETGVLRLQDQDGDSAGKYILPFIAAVPTVAGGMICAAVGDKVRGMISLAASIGVLVGHHVCLILKFPVPLHTAVMIVLAALGGIPPLVHLRKRRATPG